MRPLQRENVVDAVNTVNIVNPGWIVRLINYYRDWGINSVRA